MLPYYYNIMVFADPLQYRTVLPCLHRVLASAELLVIFQLTVGCCVSRLELRPAHIAVTAWAMVVPLLPLLHHHPLFFHLRPVPLPLLLLSLPSEHRLPSGLYRTCRDWTERPVLVIEGKPARVLGFRSFGF